MGGRDLQSCRQLVHHVGKRRIGFPSEPCHKGSDSLLLRATSRMWSLSRSYGLSSPPNPSSPCSNRAPREAIVAISQFAECTRSLSSGLSPANAHQGRFLWADSTKSMKSCLVFSPGQIRYSSSTNEMIGYHRLVGAPWRSTQSRRVSTHSMTRALIPSSNDLCSSGLTSANTEPHSKKSGRYVPT